MAKEIKNGDDAKTEATNSRAVVFRPTKVLSTLSVSEQLYILEGCRDNCRLDGRSRTDLRSFSVLTGDPLILSHGSSRVFLTDSSAHILCSVKAELVKPSLHNPEEGAIDLHVDWLLGGTRGKRRFQEQRLQSVLSFLLLQHLLPLSSLCVVPHHYAWRLGIDVMIVCSDGGSVVDLSSRAIRAALAQTKLPHVTPLSKKGKAQTDLAVDSDIHKAHSLQIDNCPVVVSVAVLKCPPKATPVFVLDTTLEEEACSSCIVQVAVSRNGKILAIQNEAGSVPFGLLPDISVAALQAADQVFAELDKNTVQTSTDSLLQEQFRKF